MEAVEPAPVVSEQEIERRFAKIRQTLAAGGIDALAVAGTEYTGFEGAIRWVSGFRMVHRYAYGLIPADGDPIAVFPAEARWVGQHDESWIDEKVFVDTPGAWMRQLAEQRGWKRLAVYGYNFAMPVRDFAAITSGDLEIIDFDLEFDLLRAVKSQEELGLVQHSFDLNERGFWKVLQAYEPGKTEAAILAPAEEMFVRNGTTRTTQNMVLSGRNGNAGPEFKHPDPVRPVEPSDLLLYSVEIAGPTTPCSGWSEWCR